MLYKRKNSTKSITCLIGNSRLRAIRYDWNIWCILGTNGWLFDNLIFSVIKGRADGNKFQNIASWKKFWSFQMTTSLSLSLFQKELKRIMETKLEERRCMVLEELDILNIRLQLQLICHVNNWCMLIVHQDAAKYRDELKIVAPHSLLKCSSDATTLVCF